MNKKPVKLLSLFSGIGSPEQALKNIGVDHELLGFSEIDKFAIKSYCNVHNVSEDLNLGDVTNIDISSLPTDIDLITHGSPCQDFSIAGHQKGGDKGTGTRSSLMWATVDIVEHCKPKVVIWENVKNVLSKKHKHNFDGYLEVMEQLGYNNYYQVLNAKDYGIPQNRERIFTISIRKDVDEGYTFPGPQELTLRLKDMLEDEVDEKYYISTCKVQQLLQNIDGKLDLNKQVIGTCHKNNSMHHSTRDIVYNAEKNAPTLTATMYKDAVKVLIPIDDKNSKTDKIIKSEIQQIVTKRKYDVDIEGLKNTLRECKKKTKLTNKEIANRLNVELTTVEHWFRTDKCFSIPDAYIWYSLKELLQIDIDTFDKSVTTFIQQEGVYEKANRVYNTEGIAPTLTNQSAEKITNNYGIRKLTPRECWRLMGFTDEQFDKAAEVCSNTQLYKQAGNSIVVNVLEAIIDNLKEIL